MTEATAPTFIERAHPHPCPAAERQALLRDPGFGRVFTDHMVSIRYSAQRGWHEANVGPREPLSLDPACAVLHYAQEIFEGMKAYRTCEGIALFRPADNAMRFQRSAARLAMPLLPVPVFIEAVERLTLIDQAWIPAGAGSLYLRPFMFATDGQLGAKAAAEYRFIVIASPVDSYLKASDGGLRVWASETYSRAAVGGTGTAKCGGNYAASLLAQRQATQHGCDQVAFLDAAEHRWIEELGSMNIFFVFKDGSLVTPPLSGTILAGITRASLITLAADAGQRVFERAYSLEEWRRDAGDGRLVEAFACGTAAVVAAIGEVHTTRGRFVIGEGSEGPCTRRLRATLTALQRGQYDDAHRWVHRLAPPSAVRS